jgi:hypothetical protein
MELDTEADLRLWLAPDWARPEDWLAPLSTYLRVAHPRGSTCLCLAAGDADPERVAALVATACEHLAGDVPFADVLIVPAAQAPPGVIPVADAPEVLDALAAPPPATAQSDEDAALARELSGADDARLEHVRRVVRY